jgi:hypothetical protein
MPGEVPLLHTAGFSLPWPLRSHAVTHASPSVAIQEQTAMDAFRWTSLSPCDPRTTGDQANHAHPIAFDRFAVALPGFYQALRGLSASTHIH